MSGPDESVRVRRGPDESGRILHRGVSEFGELLGEFLEATPGSCGVVLSDGLDDTIDTAHWPDSISAIDVCIAGAQIGQAMTRLNVSAIIFGLGPPQVVLEAHERVLISQVLWEEYLLTAVLTPHTNIARAMREFDEIAVRVLALLR